jgi:P4 family phage/plasmid primase-like protien
MAQQSGLEVVRTFAEDYRDRLIWIEDIKSFALFDTKEKYYEILDMDKMAWIMNNYIFQTTGKSYGAPNVKSSYLSYLIFETFKTIPSVFCSDMEINNRYNYIAFNDKVLNLDNFKSEELGADKIVFHKLDFNYEEVKNSKPKLWLNFLDEVLIQEDDNNKPDKDLQRLLQQMFGYCLDNTIKAQKAFFLFGASRAGKGVITSILFTLLGGAKFVTNNKLGALTGGDFTLASLVGKKANIAGEEESGQINADTFKSIVSGDPQQANRKFLSSISFTPRVKLIMSANSVLKFKYIDDAIRERLITLPFFRTVPQSQRDLDLSVKLHQELDGILSWALEGLKDLKDSNYIFHIPESSKKAMHQIESDVSNAVKFFTENFEEDEESFLQKQDLYDTYRTWCSSNGFKGVMSSNKFFSELKVVETYNSTKIRKLVNDKQARGNMIKPKEGSFVDSENNLFI